jgi:polysaccharide deacetylase 2 family uncharacterized protein YibQ
MNRRGFLFTSAIVFTGSLLGFHCLAPAHAAVFGAHPSGPKLALIIDDIEFSRQMAHRFLEIQIPITFSILPRLPFSFSIAQTTPIRKPLRVCNALSRAYHLQGVTLVYASRLITT